MLTTPQLARIRKDVASSPPPDPRELLDWLIYLSSEQDEEERSYAPDNVIFVDFSSNVGVPM